MTFSEIYRGDKEGAEKIFATMEMEDDWRPCGEFPSVELFSLRARVFPHARCGASFWLHRVRPDRVKPLSNNTKESQVKCEWLCSCMHRAESRLNENQRGTAKAWSPNAKDQRMSCVLADVARFPGQSSLSKTVFGFGQIKDRLLQPWS